MKNAYQKFISPLYVINIAFQAVITLLSPIVIMFLFAYLLTKYASVGNWIYVVFMTLGVLSGLYSMVVFIMRSSKALEAIERQNSAKEENKKKNELK